MNDVKMKNRIMSALAPFIPVVRNTVAVLSWDRLESLTEIRLRAGTPLMLVFGGERKFLAKNGCIVDKSDAQPLIICTEQMMNDAFRNICSNSVHTHLGEITSGYITMPFGHRAGICGTAVMSEGRIINVRDISSISVRISREVKGVASDISARFYKGAGGILICGAPSSGKTTLLRDMSRILSAEYSLNVSVIDTRNEISGSYRGRPQNDLGYSDVFVSYPRKRGVEQALRSMAPQVIICDEIGDEDDAEAILSAVNSGVRFVASIHAANPEELKKRAFVKDILDTKAFSAVAFLSSPAAPGRISRILSVGDVYRD